MPIKFLSTSIWKWVTSRVTQWPVCPERLEKRFLVLGLLELNYLQKIKIFIPLFLCFYELAIIQLSPKFDLLSYWTSMKFITFWINNKNHNLLFLVLLDCTRDLDMVILLDGSGSRGSKSVKKRWNSMLEFTQKFVKGFDTHSRIGIIEYGSDVKIPIDMLKAAPPEVRMTKRKMLWKKNSLERSSTYARI